MKKKVKAARRKLKKQLLDEDATKDVLLRHVYRASKALQKLQANLERDALAPPQWSAEAGRLERRLKKLYARIKKH